MLLPLSLLPDTITIEAYTGSGPYGPIYGAGQQVRARVEGRRKMVRRGGGGERSDGVEVIGSATATIRPADVTVESRVTHGDRTYEVLDVVIGEGLRRPAYLELILGGPR
jgi:hypothetical protein